MAHFVPRKTVDLSRSEDDGALERVIRCIRSEGAVLAEPVTVMAGSRAVTTITGRIDDRRFKVVRESGRGVLLAGPQTVVDRLCAALSALDL